MAEGGAMVARIDGPSAGFINPAGLAGLAHPSVSGTVNVVDYTRVAARTATGTAYADDIQLKANLVGFANILDEDSGGWALTLASPTGWSSGLKVRTDTANGTRSDDGRSSLELTCLGLAWGGHVSPHCSLGVAFEGWLVDYRLDTGTSASDTTSVLTATYTESGRQMALRLAIGSQWDVGDWHFGAMLRTPGLRLQGQGSISGSSTSSDGTTTVHDQVSDEGTGFIVPLPWQLVLGASWFPPTIPGLEIETDLAVHTGSGNAEVFAAAHRSQTTVTSVGISTVDTILPSRDLDLQPVFNPRLGLRYRFPNLFLERIVFAHLGGYIEHTPVERSDVFSRLDLLGGTTGLSFEKGPMLVTIALAYVTSGTLQDAIGFVSSPASGLSPELDDPDATYAFRTFSLSLGSSYRF